MERHYAALPSHGMQPGITFQQPVLPQPKAVSLQDPALETLTDFRSVRAITVPPTVTADFAHESMRANGVRLLLVVDDRNVLLGLITTTDIGGDKPVRLAHDRGLRYEEITVGDIMTPRERLEVIELDALQGARVGHVVATLAAVGRRHALVVERDAQGHQRVRGLLSVSQLNRQLGSALQPIETARSFAEVETALGRDG